MMPKILNLCVCSAGLIAACLPPRSSTTKSKQVEKAQDEGLLIRVVLSGVVVMPVVYALGALVYILLMVYTEHHGEDSGHSITGYRDVDVALRKLSVLQTWQVAMTLLCVSASAFRHWSYATLDRFFTFTLFIHKDHKLVETGPYKYLRHPSYTGMLTAISVSWLLLLHQGIWPVLTSWLGASFQYHVVPRAPVVFSLLLSVLRRFPLWAQITGLNGGAWAALAVTGVWIDIARRRIKNEEAMMREHFREEWDRYASKRWSMIPFVY